MKNILVLMLLSLGILGCGGGETSSVPDAPGLHPKRGDTDMDLNKLYSVVKGDEIIKTSAITKVKITHVDGSNSSSVELIEGSATLRIN